MLYDGKQSNDNQKYDPSINNNLPLVTVLQDKKLF